MIWMQEAQGPCELTLCNPGGEYWEGAGPEELSAEQAPRLRGSESRNVALIQRECWEWAVWTTHTVYGVLYGLVEYRLSRVVSLWVL